MEVSEKHAMGRVLVLHWNGVLDGTGPSPEQVRAALTHCGARRLLLDTTRAPYADSDGVRWLLRLQSHLEERGKCLRIAARPQGKVRRVLSLLQLGLETFDSVGKAWKAPWPGPLRVDLQDARRHGNDAGRPRLRRRRGPGNTA